MPSTNYAYVNGHFVRETEARVPISDRGFLYGDGVFETMRVYDGHVFRALEHFERLRAGLEMLEIEALLSPAELHAVCRALIRWNNVRDGVARVYRTRDSIVATVIERSFPPRELRAMVSTLPLHAFLSRHKTANRLVYQLAQRAAQREGADEAVLLDPNGSVIEFTTGNLFAVKRGELFTPPLRDGPLPGITRAVVLSLARAMGIRVHEISLPPAFLEQADEVFATNSLYEIAPVVTWSKRRSVTQKLREAYRDLVRFELNTPAP